MRSPFLLALAPPLLFLSLYVLLSGRRVFALFPRVCGLATPPLPSTSYSGTFFYNIPGRLLSPHTPAARISATYLDRHRLPESLTLVYSGPRRLCNLVCHVRLSGLSYSSQRSVHIGTQSRHTRTALPCEAVSHTASKPTRVAVQALIA